MVQAGAKHAEKVDLQRVGVHLQLFTDSTLVAGSIPPPRFVFRSFPIMSPPHSDM